MPVKFLEITEDPYKNTSNEFVLVLGVSIYDFPNPSSVGTINSTNGILKDPNGTVVDYLWIATSQDYTVTGSLSDEAYAHSFVHDQRTILVPPGFSLSSFGNAIAIQGTLEELAPFIRGM